MNTVARSRRIINSSGLAPHLELEDSQELYNYRE